MAKLQAERPWLLLLVAWLSLLPASFASNRLFHDLRLDFSELLPENRESVVEMRRVAQRFAGTATLSIVLRTKRPGQDRQLQACVDALVPELNRLGKEWVGAVDFGVQDAQAFFDQHAALYADLADLKRVHQRVIERYDWEVSKQQGSLLDDETEPEPITAGSLEAELGHRRTPASDAGPAFPNGYYQNARGDMIAVLVRTAVSSDAKIAEFRRLVDDAVKRVNPRRFEPSMVAEYTGDIVTRVEETNRITADLSHVGIGGVLGVMTVVFLYFARARVVLTMGAALLIGLLWTFGVTNYTIGYLNSSTGFLVSIVAGNGINYGIVYMARYGEARREQGLAVPDAIRLAHSQTWLPTLASAGTGALAYGSLVVTDFRGFKHFGVIGGYGMLFCWLATYLFAPAIIAASEQLRPAYRDDRRAHGFGQRFGSLFAHIGLWRPRVVAIAGLAVGACSIALTAWYFSRDPMEYELRNLANDEERNPSTAKRLSIEVDKIVGGVGQDGIAIVTDRLDQVQPLVAELEKRRLAAPAAQKPFEKVISIFSLLPDDQAEKLPLIDELFDRIRRARKRGFIAEADWLKLQKYVPEGKPTSVGIADLPRQAALPFMERDGTRGRVVYIAPTIGADMWDAHYLMRWADSFRHVTLPNGEVIRGSGRAVIFADMIRTIGDDAPRAILFSALGTVLVILLAFRGSPLALGVFVPWMLGVGALIGFMKLSDVRLSFLNFVAIPITIGIGAEYAHNMMQRYRLEGPGKVKKLVLATGGALTLCSLTTGIGYFALMFSINRGIHSFGLCAAVGELTCLLATVLWLPALLTHLERRSQRRAASPSGSPFGSTST